MARQNPQHRSLAEMSHHRYRNIPADFTASMDWSRHMDGPPLVHRLARMIFYGQLQQGECSRGEQRKWYKDALKVNLNIIGIKPVDLEGLAIDRTTWRATCQQAVVNFEESRVRHLEDKRRQRKTGQVNSTHLLPLTFSMTLTCVQESAALRSDCFPTDEHAWDQRSADRVDGSVHIYIQLFYSQIIGKNFIVCIYSLYN